LLSRKPSMLRAELPAEEFGKEPGRKRGPGLRIYSGRERCMLSGKEPDKEPALQLAT